jgi:hypothetical protein
MSFSPIIYEKKGGSTRLNVFLNFDMNSLSLVCKEGNPKRRTFYLILYPDVNTTTTTTTTTKPLIFTLM